MKTLGVKKDVRYLINEVSIDGESVNDTLTRVLDSILDEVLESDVDLSKYQRTNISISEENYDKLLTIKNVKGGSLVNAIKESVVVYQNRS